MQKNASNLRLRLAALLLVGSLGACGNTPQTPPAPSSEAATPMRAKTATPSGTTIAVGADPHRLDVGEGSVWVANGGADSVSRIDVATQAVVGPERAGEAAGVTLPSLVTLAGVGVAVSGTALEMLQPGGLSASGAIDLILWVLAALLLPAGAVVLLVARLRTAAISANPRGPAAE